jgi:uncharacterized membrane protein YeaQ/YmgE (transglycosylase-associated protein family)
MHMLILLPLGIALGTIARLFVLGQAGGLVMTFLLGLGGPFLLAFPGNALGWYRGPLDAPSIIAATLGAILLLLLFRVSADWRERRTA